MVTFLLNFCIVIQNTLAKAVMYVFSTLFLFFNSSFFILFSLTNITNRAIFSPMSNNNILDCKEFWKRVSKLAKPQKMTLDEIGAMIGLEKQNFRNRRSKGFFPTLTAAYTIAQRFGVTIEYLLTGSMEKPLIERNIELQKRNMELEKFREQLQTLASK